MRKTLKGEDLKDTWDEEILITGRKITNLKYVEDTTLLGPSIEETEKMFSILEAGSLTYGLEIG